MSIETTCAYDGCTKPLPEHAGSGRPSKFCPHHRQVREKETRTAARKKAAVRRRAERIAAIERPCCRAYAEATVRGWKCLQCQQYDRWRKDCGYPVAGPPGGLQSYAERAPWRPTQDDDLAMARSEFIGDGTPEGARGRVSSDPDRWYAVASRAEREREREQERIAKELEKQWEKEQEKAN